MSNPAIHREILPRPPGRTICSMPPCIPGDEDAALLAERAVLAPDAVLA